VVEKGRSIMMYVFIPIVIAFFVWWMILGFAEADVIKNKKLLKYTGIDLMRGIKRPTVEDYYG
jgi:hypothetical protein